MDASIIPLHKNKSGDLTDVHNYRAIAIAILNSRSKLLDFLLLEQLYDMIRDGHHQFDFKREHSTGLCTSVFKDTVDYYRRRL
jgi:hypothetical protein